MAGRTPSPPAAPVADRPAAELSPEVRWYLDSRGYDLPSWCEPAVRTPEPRDVAGAVFDPAAVDKVIATLCVLRHTQGKWAGRPMAPDAWQVAYIIAPVFGWLAPNEHGRMVRVIRSAFIDVARKNGKTTISSGLALYLGFADGEPGAQVLAVAGSKDQAQNAYRPAKLIAENSPLMRAAGIRPLVSHIGSPDGSFFKAAASVGDLLHGTNVHGAVVDELHVHKTSDVLDAVESGTGARDQPLVLIITTPDDGKPMTVYAAKRNYIERLARGTVSNPAEYGVIFAADEADDPFAEATQRKANPGFGISPTKEFLRSEARKAQDSPAGLARYLRLHLGIRTKQRTRFLVLSEWDRNAGLVLPDRLAAAKRAAYGGLDLGNTSDLTSVLWLWPDNAGGYDALWRFWVPEDTLSELDKRTAKNASRWAEAGWLRVTPGNVTDYERVRVQVREDLSTFAVRELAYDPWNATDLVIRLHEDGAPMVEARQGFRTLSPPLKEIKRLLKAGDEQAPLLRHGGNPVMRWMVDNLAVAMDASGNVKPDKAKSTEKIDGVSALTTAMSRAMHHKKPRKSAYSNSDLEVV